jgi:hypothetical protein
LDWGSALSQGRYLHRTTQTNKQKQISMTPVGFEPTIPVFDRPKAFRGLDLSATVLHTAYFPNTNLEFGRHRGKLPLHVTFVSPPNFGET